MSLAAGVRIRNARSMTETLQERPYRTIDDLDGALDWFRGAPTDDGQVELIVSRPEVDERQLLSEGVLDCELGLVGDTWVTRSSRRTADGGPHPDMQLNVINARFSRFVAGGDDTRAALAGDQLHLDLDLSETNLPVGTRLHIGSAVIEVTDQPHTGCAKFSARFGPHALSYVNSPVGKHLRLRGLNARVAVAGTIRVGDVVAVFRPV